MVVESWFRSLWKKQDIDAEKLHIGVLAFEAASLMSKLLYLWQSLTEKQITRLREEITNSTGIKKLVSENDDFIGKLICVEMTENLANVARAVARLSMKCSDPLLKSFEQAFNDLIMLSTDTYGWELSWKEMDRKAKKLERYIVRSTSLFHEMETLADLEQSLKRIKGSDIADSITVVEYEKKVAWKRQEVKHLKANSLWSRTYDYTILLLARSVFTLYGRIGHLFGINHVTDVGVKGSRFMISHSPVFMQSSVYPSESCVPRYSSGSLGKIISLSGPISRTKLRDSKTKSSLISNHDMVTFYSGPLGRSTLMFGSLQRASRSTLRLWQFRYKSCNGKEDTRKNANQPTASTPFTRFTTGENYAPTNNCFGHVSPTELDDINGFSIEASHASANAHQRNGPVGPKNKLLNAPPETLGAAALALHYANLIILIEKLVASPHLIGNDARDDLYNMLPASIRVLLRTKLKPYSNILTSSVYDSILAGEWNDAITLTLEWLAPLAHNMIRWQTERSIEHQNLVSRTNVLLVQTLFFANQEKTEAAITELLIGLNYIWRFGRGNHANSLVQCACASASASATATARKVDEYLDA